MTTRIRLVTDGDDLGLVPGVTTAAIDAFEHGILRNVNVMAPAPDAEEAVRRLRDVPGLCVGFHAVLTCEWKAPRWGPVLRREDVPSLVQEDGTFHFDAQAIDASDASLEQMMAELKAQFRRLRELGIEPGYLSTHMAIGWLRDYGIWEGLEAMGREYGIPFRGSAKRYMRQLPRLDEPLDDPVDDLIARLDQAQPGAYLCIIHPACDDDEMRRVVHARGDGASPAGDRDLQRRSFMDPRVIDYCRTHAVELVRYSDLTEQDLADLRAWS